MSYSLKECFSSTVFMGYLKSFKDNYLQCIFLYTSRVFNNDETPQFINCGVDGTSSGLVYAGKGDQCQKMLRENRECVTIHPFVSFSGKNFINNIFAMLLHHQNK